MIKAKNIIMKERIWINRVISEIMFSVSDTVPLHDERIITVRHVNQGCECPRSQAGTGKSAHIEIRDVVGTFSFSFNGEAQCTIDFTGHVLHARTDRDVYVSDPWHAASGVTLSSSPVPQRDSCVASSCPGKSRHIGHRAAYAYSATARTRLVILLDAIITLSFSCYYFFFFLFAG